MSIWESEIPHDRLEQPRWQRMVCSDSRLLYQALFFMPK